MDWPGGCRSSASTSTSACGRPRRSIAIANALTAYIPHFLALSASSPYWEGRDTGLASSRSKVFESLPTAGLPYQLDDWAEFEQFMETLVVGPGHHQHPRGVVGHPPPPRLRHRRAAHLRRHPDPAGGGGAGRPGPEPGRVARHPHRAGETRSPCPGSGSCEQNKWRAARHGIDAEIIVDDQGTAGPAARRRSPSWSRSCRRSAARLGCLDELTANLEVLDHGPSYLRQRGVVAAGGTLVDVVDSLVGELETDRPAPTPA